MSRRRFRGRLPFAPRPESEFRWRGREVSRLENLADAVFGFSVTLLVVAVEVPRDYAGLLRVLKGFPAFAACFAILMMFWNAHYRFFRRYGLEDLTTRTLNYAILLLVLFAVYPLKFLFTLWFDAMFWRAPVPAGAITFTDLPFVFRVYSLGFAVAWFFYYLLHRHAYRCRAQLQLTRVEEIVTQSDIHALLMLIGIALTSVLITLLPINVLAAGLIYFAIGPGMYVVYARAGRRIREFQREPQPAYAR